MVAGWALIIFREHVHGVFRRLFSSRLWNSANAMSALAALKLFLISQCLPVNCGFMVMLLCFRILFKAFSLARQGRLNIPYVIKNLEGSRAS